MRAVALCGGTWLACAMRKMLGPADPQILDPAAHAFYCTTLDTFERARLDVLVGGAYAFARYTGIERHTKDLDVFVRQTDFERTLGALADAGFECDVPFPHWLGKAHCGEFFVDVIFGAGNGVARVDDEWFAHAAVDTVFDIPARLCPPEEMLWSKAFIQERERFDGADVAHLLLARASTMDWPRLLRRFGPNWQVLLAHLVLFGFIYPSRRDLIPNWVMQELTRRLESVQSAPPAPAHICQGTLLSRQQYLVDVTAWDYADARTLPHNPMTDSEIATWTAGIACDGTQES
jgi:hypothetical protein